VIDDVDAGDGEDELALDGEPGDPLAPAEGYLVEPEEEPSDEQVAPDEDEASSE
jgi:hypothetical protein